MNTVIVYDSFFGNTELVVLKIADTLREYGQVQTVRVEHTHPLYMEEVDLLILGCPTQKWGTAPAMSTLLEYIPSEALKRLAVACFDTRLDEPQWVTGSAAERMTSKLRKRGASQLFTPASFLVKGVHGPLEDGELERAATWAAQLREQVEADPGVMMGQD
jgi:flavodoxin